MGSGDGDLEDSTVVSWKLSSTNNTLNFTTEPHPFPSHEGSSRTVLSENHAPPRVWCQCITNSLPQLVRYSSTTSERTRAAEGLAFMFPVVLSTLSVWCRERWGQIQAGSTSGQPLRMYGTGASEIYTKTVPVSVSFFSLHFFSLMRLLTLAIESLWANGCKRFKRPWTKLQDFAKFSHNGSRLADYDQMDSVKEQHYR